MLFVETMVSPRFIVVALVMNIWVLPVKKMLSPKFIVVALVMNMEASFRRHFF